MGRRRGRVGARGRVRGRGPVRRADRERDRRDRLGGRAAAAGAENLAGKVVVDVSNPIKPDSGMPPSLEFCNTESLAERIQAAFPDALVVKTLNTVNAGVMVDPASVPGSHNVFLSGEDDGAKARVRELLQDFGWPDADIVDLGGVETARGAEMYLSLWLRLMLAGGSAQFNIAVVRA